MKLQIIIGSTRQNRYSEKPAQWLFEYIKNQGVDVSLVDLRDYPMPFYDEPKTPKAFKGEYPNPAVQKWADKIKEADGYIIVTPEYNHGYPAVLKNALDSVYYEWNRKAVGFVAHGSVQGSRAVEQLRQVVVELQMVPVRNTLHIPGSVAKGEEPLDRLEGQANAFLEDLTWWTEALKVAREV